MKKGLMFVLMVMLCGTGLLFAGAEPEDTDDQTGEVEVLHWWTSGGEAAAVAVLQELLTEEGHTWIDFAVAGGGGDAAMVALRSRAVAGNPPTAAQVKGPQIQDWAAEGFLTNLDGVADEEGWDDIVPGIVADVMKYQGHWVAVPVNVHRINWMWVNPDVFEAAGVDIPATWDEFPAAAQAIEDAGYIPVAWGGQDWQEATVFETILLGVGGTDFYFDTMVNADESALSSSTMVEVFETLRMVHSFTDPGAPGRDWNLATTMVIEGQAAMQFMGDWAKGEFTAAGKEPDVDYLAVAAPDTADGFIFNIDSFIMFEVDDPGDQEAQRAMARLILSEKFQEVFNVYKGSIPVITGMSQTPFDIPARLSMDDFAATAASGDLVPSMAHEMAVARAIRGAMLDTVTIFVNSDMSPEDAVEALASAVRGAK